MKDWILNMLLSMVARGLLYILGLPLLITGTAFGLVGGNGAQYYRMLAIVLDILGCVIGGPAWNIIFFKRGAKPVIVFGYVTTMSFVFAHSYDHLNAFGRAIYNSIERIDKGHMEIAKSPAYLRTYFLHWKDSI